MSHRNSASPLTRCEYCNINEDDVLIEVRTNGKLVSKQRLCEECAEKQISEKD